MDNLELEKIDFVTIQNHQYLIKNHRKEALLTKNKKKININVLLVNNNHRENAPSNKTQALLLSQLCSRGSNTESKIFFF